jgi:hypothetical protein
MTCRCCHKEEELRQGVCFDCATLGEQRAAKRTVLGHLRQAVVNLCAGRWVYLGCDLRWARERLFRVGDYAEGGYFDREGVDWR